MQLQLDSSPPDLSDLKSFFAVAATAESSLACHARSYTKTESVEARHLLDDVVSYDGNL